MRHDANAMLIDGVQPYAHSAQSLTAGVWNEFEYFALDAERVAGIYRREPTQIAAGEIGAMIVARGIAKANPKLSREVLASSRRLFGEIGGER